MLAQNMIIIFLLIIAVTIYSADNIIDVEAKKLTELWTNGSFIPLKLNKDANVDALISEFQRAYQEANQEWKDCKVLDNKKITIPQFDGGEYIAVLVKHSKGMAIIYLRYEEQSQYWWNKSYPIR